LRPAAAFLAAFELPTARSYAVDLGGGQSVEFVGFTTFVLWKYSKLGRPEALAANKKVITITIVFQIETPII